MIAFGLDDTGDLDFNPDTGVFNMVSDEDELAQKLFLLLGENIGEIPWNEDIGLNQADVIANGDDEDVVNSILTEYLEDQWPDKFDSLELTSFDVDKQDRLTTAAGTVTLTDGTNVPFNVSENNDNDDGDTTGEGDNDADDS